MSKYNNNSSNCRSVLFILLAGSAGVVGACASNELRDRYRFDVVNQPVPIGTYSPITVRLADRSTGKPVDGATVSRAFLKMRMTNDVPPGKGIWLERYHSEAVRIAGSFGVGQYRLIGEVSMPGTWSLFLTANVPGEASPIEGSTTFVAGRQRFDP